MARREHTPGAPRPTYAMRLGDDERQVLEQAASARGVPLSRYVRGAALAAARRELEESGASQGAE